MEGEGWGVGFVAVSGESVGVGSGRVAEVFGVDAAVGVEALSETHADESAARAVDVEKDVADHVLTHVKDDGVGFVGRVHRNRMESVGDGDREVGLGGKFEFGRDGSDDGGGPVGGGEVRAVPA